jgi:protein-S-isoprenylcysteine O-methyltransferase Ste14
MQSTIAVLLLLSQQPTSSSAFSSLPSLRVSCTSIDSCTSRQPQLRVRQQESAHSTPRFIHLSAAKDKNIDADDKSINLEKGKDFEEAADFLNGFQSDMRAQEESSLESESQPTSAIASGSSDAHLKNLNLNLKLKLIQHRTKESLQDTKAHFKSLFQSPKIKSLRQTIKQATKSAGTNIFKGEVGKRGEIFVVLQLFLTYSIFIGHVPLLKNFVKALFGPILLVGGLVTMIDSVQEMHSRKSFTAFTTPVSTEDGGTLVNSGVYGFVRHPVYAGNLAAMVGWSVMSNSAMRLFLTLGYYMVVERKVKREEEEMKKQFEQGQDKSYDQYMVDVPDRFIPFKWINGVFDRVVKKEKEDAKETEGDDNIVMLEKQKEAVHNDKLDSLFEIEKSKIEIEKDESVDDTKLNGASSVNGTASTRTSKFLYP